MTGAEFIENADIRSVYLSDCQGGYPMKAMDLAAHQQSGRKAADPSGPLESAGLRRPRPHRNAETGICQLRRNSEIQK